MTTKYIQPPQTEQEIAAEKEYNDKNAYFGNLYLIDEKRKAMVSNTSGVVLEIASGCLQTLPHYAQRNNQVKTIIFSEPMDMVYSVGIRTIANKIDNQAETYVGSYDKITGIKNKDGVEIKAWKFKFDQVKGDVSDEDDVPVGVQCYYIQSALDGIGGLVTQLLPETKVDTVVSSFGVCYVCCSIHPLEYLHQIQTIFGPKKSENTYRLCMLEHGQTKHPDVNPAENRWVVQDGGKAFRHLFELIADSRLIIHNLEHHLKTNETENPQTFHIYQAEPNDQTEWIKKKQQ